MVKNDVVFCDLDGTIIFSHRFDIGERILVERFGGREQAYISKLGYERLQTFPRDRFIPLTSRTLAQYGRISFYKDGGCPRYALLDNGGILLVDNEPDGEWLRETKELIEPDRERLEELAGRFSDKAEIKWQDDMVLFVKASDSVDIRAYADQNGLLSFDHGSKLYVCSGKLTKGRAIRRFKKRFPVNRVTAAGDSGVDISMAREADEAYFSDVLESIVGIRDGVRYVEAVTIAERIFYDKRY